MSNDSALYSDEAERYSVGAMLTEPAQTMILVDKMYVTADWFVVPKWRYVFQAMHSLRLDGHMIERASVIEWLREKKYFTFVTKAGINECIGACLDPKQAMYYLRKIRDRYIKRLIRSTMAEYECMLEGDQDADELLSSLRFDLAHLAPEEMKVKTAAEVIAGVAQQYRHADETGSLGIPSRWQCVQKVTGGYYDGKMVVMASRPKNGKTMAMCNELIHKAAPPHNIACDLISLEMTEDEVWARWVGDVGGFDLFKFRQGEYGQEEIDRFEAIGNTIAKYPLKVYSGVRTIENIAGLIHDSEAKMIGIDYVQRVKQSPDDPKTERERFARYSAIIANAALSTNKTVILNAQLNRDAEFDRNGKRILPQAKHLKGCGNFEEDAFAIILIARSLDLEQDEEYNENQPMVMKIVYNRGGPTDVIDFTFQKQLQRFTPTAAIGF